MKRKLQTLLVAIGVVAGFGLVVPNSTSAISVWNNSACKNSDSAVCAQKGDDIKPMIKNITNVVIWLAGAIAVIMIIYGGIRYAISAGDAGKVAAAKNTIIYACVGLVVAVLAYAIVSFIISNVL